jgi:prepilin-type N-terminal cleavage/methylation domain-containing protein
MKKSQAGFTLVEIAIVLVIIGLLLGGVLKGQELINNAKARNVINDMNSVQAAFYSYQDRYRVMPGDDSGADARFTGTQQNGNGNGVFQGGYSTTGALSATTDSQNFWQHVRAAGFIKGAETDAAQPRSSVGGMIGIEDSAFGIAGLVVCASVESKYAPIIDSYLDDGVGTTGDVRGSAAGGIDAATGTGTAGTAYASPDAANPYVTVCKKI